MTSPQKSLLAKGQEGTGRKYWMVNGGHILHPTIQDQEKCMAKKHITHKTHNTARVITSGCNTAVEHLSIFVEKVLYGVASELPPRIKNTNHMLDIIDDTNNSNLYPDSVLASFDIINMFSSIYNKMEMNYVIKFL